MKNLANNIQPISDDQELAKVLAGVSGQADEAAADNFTMPAPTPPPMPAVDQPAPDSAPVEAPAPEPSAPASSQQPEPVMSAPTANLGNLDSIKQEALVELRPLVDKLEVSPEEKFDTYLLLLRSTDDQDLVGPAHEAARAIADESRRAQALLDVIKEIDYLSNRQS